MIATVATLGPEAYGDPEYFRREIRTLGDQTWLFACFADEVANVDDWVRRTIAGVDLVVQNFKGELRAFDNLCSHRFFPIRRERAGSGTLRCGFHAWTYNRDGVPTGIPRNAECFGLSRDDQQRLALRRFELATIGRFVFVSVAANPPPIRAFLGRYATLLETISTQLGALRHARVKPSVANWKYSYELTLEDYHAQAVHPDSFGSVVLPRHAYFYEREGLHSHFMKRRDPDWSFQYFWDDLPTGKLDLTGYKIFSLFPTSYFVMFANHFFFGSFVPLAADSTRIETYIFDWAGEPLPAATVDALVAGYKIVDEDQAIAEGMQSSTWRAGQTGLLGALEQRIAWFHASHASVMAAAESASHR